MASQTTETPATDTPLTAVRAAADFRPIADYGLLADCTSAALVSSAGSIDWLCLPRFDSPAVFTRLLDPDAGHWSITPVEDFEVTRRYLPGTLVIETTFTTASGSVRLTDALAFSRASAGTTSARTRRTSCCAGRGRRGDGGAALRARAAPRVRPRAPALPLEAFGGRTFGGPNRIAVRAGVRMELDDANDARDLRRRRGRAGRLRLRWAAPDDPAPPRPARRGGRCAHRRHRRGLALVGGRARGLQGRLSRVVQLSARVLKGLTYRPTGAIVAAPTAGLPETEGGERNWDYRYAWVRDASLTDQALHIGACSDEAGDFVSFMASSAGGRVDGTSRSCTASTGARSRRARASPPPRLARLQARADRQRRLGPDAARRLRRAPRRPLPRPRALGELHPEIQRFVADLADTAARAWTGRGAGMWEMRGEPRHHVSSKVFCWVALDRAVKLAPQLGERAEPGEWAEERDRIRATILERGWSEKRQAFAQSFDSDQLDAAALLMPIVGFLPATDPRMRSTIEAIAQDLTEDGLVLRYRNEEGLNADGLDRRGGHLRALLVLARLVPRPGR